MSKRGIETWTELTLRWMHGGATRGISGAVRSVAHRTHEMGVRLALGTTPTRLRKELLCQALISVVLGTLCGIVGALLAARLLGNLIEGASSFNPTTYVAAMLFICFVASLSIWTATQRISRMDVVEILRAE